LYFTRARVVRHTSDNRGREGTAKTRPVRRVPGRTRITREGYTILCVTFALFASSRFKFHPMRAIMPEADIVLYNAVVRTLDDSCTVAEAIALHGNEVLALGESAAMRALAAPGAMLRDLRGRAVIPGLIDSHNHLLSTGLNLDAVDLSRARTVWDV